MNCMLFFGYRVGDIGYCYMGSAGKVTQDRMVGIGVITRRPTTRLAKVLQRGV